MEDSPTQVEKVDWFRKLNSEQYEFMLKAFDKIQKKALPGVYFNPERLASYLEGGTCSSVAFAFAQFFLGHKIEDHPQIVLKALKEYMGEAQYFRALQIAFNTIEKSTQIESADFKWAKIQSIAHYYDLFFDFASQDLHLDVLKARPSLFEQEINSLPQGAYILRTLRYADNHKDEFWGHTAFYLKNSRGDYFYDPNYGLTAIEEQKSAEFILAHLCLLEEIWETTNPRFYRIREG